MSAPASWTWSTVGEVGSIDLGRQRHPDWHHGPEMRPYLRVANVFEDRIDTSDLKEMDFSGCFERYRLHVGDVLLNEGQSPELLGRPAIYRGEPRDVAFTNTLIRFRPDRRVTSDWALTVFRHYMHSGRFSREARITTNIAHLSAARLKTVEFPIPPIEEQRRIVALLEEHLSDLDDAARSLGSASQRSEALWLSAMRRAREIAETDGALSSIGHLADTSLGKMLDAKRQRGEPTPYLRNINVRWGRFDLGDLHSTALTDADRDRLVLEEGDLLVCEGGEPGRCAVWTESGSRIAFQKALHRVRILDRKRLAPDFLAAMIEEGIRAGRWERYFTGTTIKHLTQQQLRRLEIPLPTMKTQDVLVAQLSDQRKLLDRLRSQVARTERQAQVLRRAVLASAFSGRLTSIASLDDLNEQAGTHSEQVI